MLILKAIVTVLNPVFVVSKTTPSVDIDTGIKLLCSNVIAQASIMCVYHRRNTDQLLIKNVMLT